MTESAKEREHRLDARRMTEHQRGGGSTGGTRGPCVVVVMMTLYVMRVLCWWGYR